VLALCTALAVTLGAATDRTPDPAPASDLAIPDPLVLGSGRWADGAGPVPAASYLRGVLRVGRGTGRVVLDLTGARVTGIPRGCRPSTIVRARSWISDDAAQLVCKPRPGVTRLRVPVLVGSRPALQVQGHVRVGRGGRVEQYDLPSRSIRGDGRGPTPRMRLVSSPDFLNADVADLSRGPSSWTPERSQNGVNEAYRRTLDRVLDTWAGLDPVGVLVAGDLVDGRWGVDPQGTGTFGPVRTADERRRALVRAAGTYYPQWLERFTARGLTTYPAIGDHEYGDNSWPAAKRALAPAFRQQFAQHLLRDAGGQRRFADHPRGRAAKTAYAVRPTPDLQLVSLDVFDITPARERIGLDPDQAAWLEGVLRRARDDGVRWVVVQGHVPIAYPVPTRGSSRLHYPGGTDSALWRTLERYDVDLYLAGEAHDVSAVTVGGVTQVTHGGLFQFGLTNFLDLEFYDEGLYLTLRDFTMRTGEARNGTRLWETERRGMPKRISVAPRTHTIGTAVLTDDGIASRTGVLRPLRSERSR